MKLRLSEYLQRIKPHSKVSDPISFVCGLFSSAGHEKFEIVQYESNEIAKSIYYGNRNLSVKGAKGRKGFPTPIKRDNVVSFFDDNIAEDDSLIVIMENFGISNGRKTDKLLFYNALCTQLQNFIKDPKEYIEDIVADEFAKLLQNEITVKTELTQAECDKLKQDLDNLGYVVLKLNPIRDVLRYNDFAPTPFPTIIFTLMDEVSDALRCNFFNKDIRDDIEEFLKRQIAFAEFLRKFSSEIKDNQGNLTEYSQITGISLDIDTPVTKVPYASKLTLQNLREPYYWAIDTVINLEKELTNTIKLFRTPVGTQTGTAKK